ncbi:flavodoxin domain-containing protein [Geobacillus phage GR1]|nr:flavodoxin domain-containing protein [Geobacillus phage GR1]
MSSPILLVISSKTGNTRTFVDFFKEHCSREVIVCEDYSASLKDYDKIAFGCYTWGNGKIPKQLKEFLIKNHHLLKDKEVFIFGSGNSIYPRFCGAVDGVSKICSDSGAKIVGTFKFEQRFNTLNFDKEEIDNLIEIIKEWSA